MYFNISTNLAYKCNMHARGGPCFYTRKTIDSFKIHRNHITSFKKISKSHSTSLAYFVRRYKKDKIKYDLSSSIISRAQRQNILSRRCVLGPGVSLFRLWINEMIINSISEIMSRYLHS